MGWVDIEGCPVAGCEHSKLLHNTEATGVRCMVANCHCWARRPIVTEGDDIVSDMTDSTESSAGEVPAIPGLRPIPASNNVTDGNGRAWTRCASAGCWNPVVDLIERIPLCAEHRDLLVQWASCASLDCLAPVVETVAGVQLCQRHRDQVRRHFTGEVSSVVYYATWDGGKTIKIGTTTNPGARLRDHAEAAGAPVELLAAHPGARQEEAQQHRRFRSFLLPGEREIFEAGPELLEHIDSIRQLWPDWESLTESVTRLATYRDNNRYRNSGVTR